MKLSTLTIWVTLFSIAMGFLESAVVVYLRAILYPHGFAFPLVTINEQLALTEVLREAATVIMLLGIGALAGRNFPERFAWFIYSFAIWDIFYYVFLKLLLNWPESWMTWDILFLIPTNWVGPVITPIIVSLTMIALATTVLLASYKLGKVKIHKKEWLLFISGSIILIVSFTWEYSAYVLHRYNIFEIWSLPKEKLVQLTIHYIPQHFNWWLFVTGELVIISGILNFYKRNGK